jgi:hypothetical protein
MFVRVLETEYRKDHIVWLRFEDGVEGQIDLGSELWGEMFEPLKDTDLFSQFLVDEDFGTLVWPNGADFAPEFLYHQLVPGASQPHGAA